MDLDPIVAVVAPVGVDNALVLAAASVVVADTDSVNLLSIVAFVVAGNGVDIALAAATAGAVAGAAAVVVHADAMHC